MLNLDIINGSFEFIGALFQCVQVRQIIKDKEVKGVHWLPISFFSLWGYWNLIYYPSLNQWFSFTGGLLLAIITSIWLVLIFKYSVLKTDTN